MFRLAYVQAGPLRIHYRTGGAGPAVVMLHPSPLSSAAVLPVATELAKHFQVFALDTPGYGLSDPLPSRPASLDPYLPVLAATLDALGLGRVCLYGAATGAQIAVEFARRYPDRIALLVMDSAGHIPADDCERIVRDYFPDVTPRRDGSHLATLWTMVRDLGVFFPWCEATRASRVGRDLPPVAAMQSMLLDYLRAGTRYDWAYRPAFYNERAERVQALAVPGLLVRWPSSIALAITDALIAAGLPAGMHVLETGPTLEERGRSIAEAISARYREPARGGIPPAATPPGRLSGDYVDVRGTQLHLRVASAGGSRPLVALHGAGGSARTLERLLAPLAGTRPLIALDLPGHGESTTLASCPDFTPAALADAVTEALDALAIPGCDLLGQGIGAAVAVELARRDPRRHGRIITLPSPFGDGAAAVDAPWPGLAPRLDGAHLLEAWHLLRDRRLWSPWHLRTRAAIRDTEPALDADELQFELTELMRCGERFAAAARAEAASDVPRLLAQVQGPVQAGVDGGAADAPARRDRLRALPHTTILDVTGPAVATGAAIRAWLKE